MRFVLVIVAALLLCGSLCADPIKSVWGFAPAKSSPVSVWGFADAKPATAVKAVKSCQCSEQCTCGCNAGGACQCGKAQAVPQAQAAAADPGVCLTGR